jgi:cyclopropane fatty-acyl-phospholipid synthase-like methyltransferase
LAASATDLIQEDLNQHLGLESYTSNALKLFMKHLDQQPQSRLLDVGPVCQENIRFFARRVSKHYVCDMFIRLDRNIRKGDSVYKIWNELDYHPESFDGILVWELADRLDEQGVNRLVTLCHSMLKPGGMAVIMVMGDQVASSETRSFVVGQNYRIYLRPQPHLELPLRGRQNRDVLSMMAPFIPAKSFICRPGFMEFLFRRE